MRLLSSDTIQPVAQWKFSPGHEFPFRSLCGGYLLEPRGDGIGFFDDPELNQAVLEFSRGGWLELPRSRLGALDIHGPGATVTVCVKVRISRPDLYQAIAGVWDETHSKRQYCLFYNINTRYESEGNAHGHISHVGGATPGHRFCVTYATGATRLPVGEWIDLAMVYDGRDIRVYVNGQLDQNPRADPFRGNRSLNPYNYPGSIFDGGRNGAPFTVGGVHRSGEMGNWFIGRLAELTVYDSALADGLA
jgi:hypothetical protein